MQGRQRASDGLGGVRRRLRQHLAVAARGGHGVQDAYPIMLVAPTPALLVGELDPEDEPEQDDDVERDGCLFPAPLSDDRWVVNVQLHAGLLRVEQHGLRGSRDERDDSREDQREHLAADRKPRSPHPLDPRSRTGPRRRGAGSSRTHP